MAPKSVLKLETRQMWSLEEVGLTDEPVLGQTV